MTTYLFNHQKNDIARLLYHNDIPPATKDNFFQLITDDVEAYHTLLQEIERAKESIDICTYVFSFDSMSESLMQSLTKRAREGVRVRILIDLVGSFGTFLHQKRFDELKSAGGEVLFFAPILKRPFQNYINLRNHRKIYLFDQQRVLSGGMNLSDEYMGRDKTKKRWKDLLYFLEGIAVHNFYTIFENDWAYASGKKVTISFKPIPIYQGKSTIQVVPSGPDIKSDALYKALLDAIYSAKSRIWIVTPYFVPDENILEALEVACDKGIDLRLITPKISNHFIADITRSSYVRELEKIGANLSFYEGEMLHAKAILFDETLAIVGSLNLDNRSLFLNYEIVSFLYTKDDIVKLLEWMEELKINSTNKLKKPSKFREAIENVAKVLAPMM
jgi:cardiolipin synthase